MKRWSKRRFFKFWYDTTGIPEVQTTDGAFTIITPQVRTWIYGVEEDSEYDDDHAYVDRVTEQGMIYGRWFSEVCLDGDIGVNRLARMIEITEAEFEAAKQR